MTIRVLVADDQEMVRAGFAMILSAQEDIEVVATCAKGVEAVDAARRLRPDITLVDIRMPRMDGLEVTRRLAGPCMGTRRRAVRLAGHRQDAPGVHRRQAGLAKPRRDRHAGIGERPLRGRLTRCRLDRSAEVRRRTPAGWLMRQPAVAPQHGAMTAAPPPPTRGPAPDVVAVPEPATPTVGPPVPPRIVALDVLRGFA